MSQPITSLPTDELKLDEIKIAILFTPGHTKGAVSYWIKDALFSGDTLFMRDNQQDLLKFK